MNDEAHEDLGNMGGSHTDTVRHDSPTHVDTYLNPHLTPLFLRNSCTIHAGAWLRVPLIRNVLLKRDRVDLRRPDSFDVSRRSRARIRSSTGRSGLRAFAKQMRPPSNHNTPQAA